MRFKNLWLRMFNISYYSDLHATRMLLAISELACATLLLFVGNTLSYPSYTIMTSIMSDGAWAFLFLLMGMTQISILASGDYHSPFPVWFAAINQSVWWFMIISMMVSSPQSPPLAMGGYLALAIGASWVWIRSGHRTDRRANHG